MSFLRKKWKYIAFGLAMGVFAAGINMNHMSKGTEAAVLVMDEKNIAQAVEEVIRTTKILNTEQQNLLIQILQSKKFDASILDRMVNTSKDSHGFLNDCLGNYHGLLGQNTTSESYIRRQIGIVEDVFNGDITVYDGYKLWEKGIKARENAARDAAATAKASQEVVRNASKGTIQGLEDTKNAEGTVQLLTAGNEIQASANDIAAAQVQVDAAYLEMQATKMQQENVEKAAKEQYRRACIDQLNNVDFSYVEKRNAQGWR